MASLPYEDRIRLHAETKCFSIDPFNEIGLPQEERDALLIRDFLKSYRGLSEGVAAKVNARYFGAGDRLGT